jgi:signal transduction histidine kinase
MEESAHIRPNVNGGWIHARVHREGNNAIFSISNSSEVIPVDMQTRLFERFFRVSESHARASQVVQDLAKFLPRNRISARREIETGIRKWHDVSAQSEPGSH